MTIVYNAVLIRFANGHTYVDRSNGAGRRELYLEMGGIEDEQLARQLGAQFLALSRDEITTVVQQGQVRAIDEVPGLALSLADTIDDRMVQSLASSITGDGDAQVTVELGDARKQRIDALTRQLQRAASGMRSEFSAPAIDGQDQGQGTDTTPPAFSQSGAATVTFSPPWIAPRPYHMAHLELAATIPGGASKIRVMRNRIYVGEGVLPTGDLRAVRIIDRGWNTGDEMILVCSVAGAGVSDLSATPRGTMI